MVLIAIMQNYSLDDSAVCRPFSFFTKAMAVLHAMLIWCEIWWHITMSWFANSNHGILKVIKGILICMSILV